MKYVYHPCAIPMAQRKSLNDKVLYLVNNNCAADACITPEDIFNTYTGSGGLHELNRNDYHNYHAYSDAKKEIEQGQFFTPPRLCHFVTECLNLSREDLVADLTCGMGNFFNFMPEESNIYGCEIDANAFKVAHFLYSAANLELTDIRTYKPNIHFDYIVGNPPFNLKWQINDETSVLSQLYYCEKSAALLKPLGIMALIVPQSFLADSFTDGGMIEQMEHSFSYLGQVLLPDDAFSSVGVTQFSTKLQFWQKKSDMAGFISKPYHTASDFILPADYDIHSDSLHIYHSLLAEAKKGLEYNKAHILLELARHRTTSDGFLYQTKKLLYHIRIHPAAKSRYAKCREYLHRFYMERQPSDQSYEEWNKIRLTEEKVLIYLRAALNQQNKKPEKDVIALVKKNIILFTRDTVQRLGAE